MMFLSEVAVATHRPFCGVVGAGCMFDVDNAG